MCAAANIWCIIYNTGMLVVDYISINEWTSTKYHMRFVSKKMDGIFSLDRLVTRFALR